MTKKRAEGLPSTHVDCLFSGLVVPSIHPRPNVSKCFSSPIEAVLMDRYTVDDFVRLGGGHGHQCLWTHSTVLEGSYGPLESLRGPPGP